MAMALPLALMPAPRIFVILLRAAAVPLGALLTLFMFLVHHLSLLLPMPMRRRLFNSNGPHHRLHHEMSPFISTTEELDYLPPHEAHHPTLFRQPIHSHPHPSLHLQAFMPSLLFDSLRPHPHHPEQHGDGSPTCSICLEPLMHFDEVRCLPLCGHVFHTACIDVWILRRCRQLACPLCRALLNLDTCAPSSN
ncbi:hypothetical protein GOP47_0028887 [Adiantum capillus-veneris]|nr:hypothetical protein GOP47_0028887 [Adiantum capillus-veneris]